MRYDKKHSSILISLIYSVIMNNTRRTGIAILLAGTLAVICLSSSALASPSRASSQAARPAPKGNCPNVADLEAALKGYRETEQVLQERIRELEKAQRKLLELEEEQKKLLEQSKPEPLPPPKPQSGASFEWVLGGAFIFAIALCVIFLLRMNRPKAINESRVREEPAGSEETSVGFTSPGSASGTGAKPRQDKTFAPALPDWDSASPALDSQSLKALLPEKNNRNRDSTIELAEIMLSFGRINSAAEALANFIENYPKEAFAPWLKLLEVYRGNGQRTEFDKIAQKLNKTFNVWTVDWDNFTDALTPVRSLETMPHIVERLQKLWGTRKCQAYLQHLLCDTRDETRRGFPLAAIEDILCLNDILEYYLGPYTGPINAFGNDLVDINPVTEIEGDEPDSEENSAEQSGAGQDTAGS
jgi:TolA-binding protein